MEQVIVLRPSTQAQVGGLNVGLMALKMDEKDPEVVVAVSNPETRRPERHRARPGDSFRVAGRGFRVVEIVVSDRGRVALSVHWDETL